MKFLIDAQLPRRLARIIQIAGHDALHTLDLPLQNRTPDSEIIRLAEQEDRVVISKDADFVHLHILHGRPSKLLLISTDNLTNQELEALFTPYLETIAALFEAHRFIELSKTALVVRR